MQSGYEMRPVVPGIIYSGCFSVFLHVTVACCGALAACFRTLHAVQAVVFPAFCGTRFACFDANAEDIESEVARVGQRRCRVFAHFGAFDRELDAAPHHVDFFFFEAGVETIFTHGLALIYFI